MFDEFLSEAVKLRSQGRPFAVAIVVRYQPPVSGKPGDKVIIQADGTIWGWIGGGCVQPAVVREALEALRDGKTRLIRIAPSQAPDSGDGVVNYTMTCHGGGALEIYIEPVLARPQIVILGRSNAAQTLCKLGKAIGYAVIVAAPGAHREQFPEADVVRQEFDFREIEITSETYVVVSTQGNLDEEALEQALRTTAQYVSFVGSQAKTQKILNLLAGQGMAPHLLNRLKAPAGIHLHTLTPEEIAVSILAEIISFRRSGAPALTNEPTSNRVALPELETDPVCGMQVNSATTKHTSEFAGHSYYFCCAGCKQTFDKEPSVYAGSPLTADRSGNFKP
jgi:xanthine dehydrogenase accessory factor